MNDLQNTKASELSMHFEATRLNQMYNLAKQFHSAGCFGSDVKNPEQALVKIQAGFEIGLAPVEAMNSLYIVKGKITMWGAALAKRLRQFGWHIDYQEENQNQVTAVITQGTESHKYTATVEEVRKLNSEALKFATKDKLRWHALGRLVRFSVPEVLGASANYLKEEVDDFAERSFVEDVTPNRFNDSDIADDIANAKNNDDLNVIKAKLIDARFDDSTNKKLKELFFVKAKEIKNIKEKEAQKVKEVEADQDLTNKSALEMTNSECAEYIFNKKNNNE